MDPILIEIFTDGSVSGQNSPIRCGSFCAIIVLPDKSQHTIAGVFNDPYIGRMELSAMNNALAYVEKLMTSRGQIIGMCEVLVSVDAEYIRDCATGRKKRHQNRDLWSQFDVLAQMFRSLTVQQRPRNTEELQGRCDLIAGEIRMAVENAMAQTLARLNSNPDDLVHKTA